MPYQIEWYVPNRVLMIRCWGEYANEDVSVMSQEVLKHSRTAPQPVHLLVDARELTRLPSSYATLIKELNTFNREPSLGWSVLVTDQGLNRLYKLLPANVVRRPVVALTEWSGVHSALLQADESLHESLPQ